VRVAGDGGEIDRRQVRLPRRLEGRREAAADLGLVVDVVGLLLVVAREDGADERVLAGAQVDFPARRFYGRTSKDGRKGHTK
jgi:hypothetical protein